MFKIKTFIKIVLGRYIFASNRIPSQRENPI